MRGEISFKNDLTYDSFKWEHENSICRKRKAELELQKRQVENDYRLARRLQSQFDTEYEDYLINQLDDEDSFKTIESNSSDETFLSYDDHCTCCKCRKRLAAKWRDADSMNSTPRTSSPISSSAKHLKELGKKIDEGTLQFNDSISAEPVLKPFKTLQPVNEANIRRKWLADVISDLLDGNFSKALSRFSTCAVSDLVDTFSDIYQVIKNAVKSSMNQPLTSIVKFLFGFLFEMF